MMFNGPLQCRAVELSKIVDARIDWGAHRPAIKLGQDNSEKEQADENQADNKQHYTIHRLN